MVNKQQRSTSYMGIAAMITAITGIVGLLLSQAHQASITVDVQDSVLELLQYRLGKIEERLDKQGEGIVNLRVDLAARLGRKFLPLTTESPPEPDPVPASMPAPPEAEESRDKAPKPKVHKMVQRVMARKSVNLRDVVQFVEQKGRPLQQADLEE